MSVNFKLASALFCVLALILFNFNLNFEISLLEKCELNKCPLCYGTDMCEFIKNEDIQLDFSSFEKIFNNYLSVKNVLFAKFKNENVVLKKLGQDGELVKVLTVVKTLSTSKYREFLTNSVIDSFYKPTNDDSVKNFHVCDLETAEFFLEFLYSESLTLEQIWTIKQVNVEPLLLNVFKHDEGWPVPKFFGACGWMIVESYCGLSLNYFKNYSWKERALIAINILNAVEDFTISHNYFSLYLTDISPDNIVVDEEFNVYFVDLENAILQMKNNATRQNFHELHHHKSRNFEEESYLFSTEDICAHPLSDHNIFSVCKLILSPHAAWPMMKGGLLHSPPKLLMNHDLFKYISLCVDADEKINRFSVTKVIVNLLVELMNIHD